MGVADQRWMLRTVDQCYENLQRLVEWGYPFPTRARAASSTSPTCAAPTTCASCAAGCFAAGRQGPRPPPGARSSCPTATTVTGAAGLVRAPARTGASRPAPSCSPPAAAPSSSASSGATGLTGDGLLMAAEAGAALSGMEFTGKYTLAPYGTSLNKGLPFRWAIVPRRGRHAAPATPRASRSSNGIGGGARRTSPGRSSPGPVYARLDLAERAAAGLAAPGPAQLLPALRPPRHRSLPRALPRRAEARGHGARHRRHPRHQPECDDRGAGALRRRRRREPRGRGGRDLGRRRGQLVLGDRRAAGGRARAPPRYARRRGGPAAFRAVSRRLGSAGLRPTERPRAVDPRDVVGGASATR